MNSAVVLQELQDTIYKQWPLEKPPHRNKVEWLGCGPETYTFCVDGHLPVDVRMFTFKDLVAARQNKPGVKAPRIRSLRAKLPNPADKDRFM